MIYRVALKVGYYENWFDFVSGVDALGFASAMIIHHVPNEDRSELPTVSVQVMKDTKDTKDVVEEDE